MYVWCPHTHTDHLSPCVSPRWLCRASPLHSISSRFHFNSVSCFFFVRFKKWFCSIFCFLFCSSLVSSLSSSQLLLICFRCERLLPTPHLYCVPSSCAKRWFSIKILVLCVCTAVLCTTWSLSHLHSACVLCCWVSGRVQISEYNLLHENRHVLVFAPHICSFFFFNFIFCVNFILFLANQFVSVCLCTGDGYAYRCSTLRTPSMPLNIFLHFINYRSRQWMAKREFNNNNNYYYYYLRFIIYFYIRWFVAIDIISWVLFKKWKKKWRKQKINQTTSHSVSARVGKKWFMN